MMVFEYFQTVDLNPYAMLVQFRIWVSESYKAVVEHYHYWFLKDPTPTPPTDPWFLDMPTESVETPPVNGVVDLTSSDDEH